MIGLIGAMALEINHLIDLVENPTVTSLGDMKYVSGKLLGRDAVLAVCGPGKVNAALCAQGLILRFQPDCVINLGVGGAVAEGLHIGDVVVATGAVQHDMDTSPLGDPVGFISGIGRVELPCDLALSHKLLAAAKAVGVPAALGLVATGDQFINSGEKRAWIAQSFHAAVCEMEGGAIAHACLMHHVPCGILRSISDNADGHSDMDYPAFVQLAAQHSSDIIKAFLNAES